MAHDDPDAPTSSKTWLNLFWRTFFLLALLLTCSVMAWIRTLHEMQFEPRATQTAHHIASLVNLSRAAVVYADSKDRLSLLKTMKEQESLTIMLRKPEDVVEPFDTDAFSQHIAHELKIKLGAGTLLANRVHQIDGLWISFSIDKTPYWLRTDRSRLVQPMGHNWLIWMIISVLLSLFGAAWIARLINRPLKDLSFATSRAQGGDFASSVLDESVTTNEIREMNIGFNQMTQKLSKIEQDRAVMLAGISHDLRTPLARLRLEAELSVSDADALGNMADDIGQLESIIDKFLDYARPGNRGLEVLPLNAAIETCLQSFGKRTDMEFKVTVAEDLHIMADPVEVQRIFTNLLENASRYGKSSDTGLAMVEITAKGKDKSVLIRVRDHGAGVPPEQLKQLTTPFYRGEAARTEANGTGLGLSIVEKSISRMGGMFELNNASNGGLCANIKLQRGFPAAAGKFDRHHFSRRS